MAVFFKNDCKFNGCGKTFPTLSSLIEHIEATHIDFDPKVAADFEDHSSGGIPLSYVLKYSHCRQVCETTSADIRIRLIQHATKSVLERQNNRLGYQMEDEETFSESESSNDSWTPAKEVVLPEKKNGASNWLHKDKPFACSVPGCKKRYKNINGIKYHYKNGHKIFEKPKRNVKHVPNKRNRGHNLKMFAKKLAQNKALAIHFPCTSKAANAVPTKMLPATKDYNGLKWTESNEECKLTVPKQEEDMENFIPTSLYTSNNEFLPVECTATFVNTCTQWSTVASIPRNDLTIIRPSMESNDVANTFVTYFNGCNNSQNICT